MARAREGGRVSRKRGTPRKISLRESRVESDGETGRWVRVRLRRSSYIFSFSERDRAPGFPEDERCRKEGEGSAGDRGPSEQITITRHRAAVSAQKSMDCESRPDRSSDRARRSVAKRTRRATPNGRCRSEEH